VFQPSTLITLSVLVGTGALTAGVAAASASPVLRKAQVRIAFTAPGSCAVTASYTVDGPSPAGIEHRLHAPPGVRVEQLRVGGMAAAPDDIVRRGVTLSYSVNAGTGGSHTYELAYRILRSDDGAYRCPIWLPVAPADGRSRSVRLLVELPFEARPAGSSLPALTWSGPRGETTLGHLPSFVRVPFASAGSAPGGLAGWDVSRITDGAAVVALSAASLLWFLRRRTTRGRAAPSGVRPE
jgi:hypothetical protein